MAYHRSMQGETIEDFRAGGTEAGEKAGKEMVTKCCPPGNVDPEKFAGGLLKAVNEAAEQMRAGGASPPNVVAWLESFQLALQPYMQQAMKAMGKG